MKRLLLLGLSTAALAGCATPQYPVTQGYAAPAPITPKYPARQTPAPDPLPDPAPSTSRSTAAEDEPQPSAAPERPALTRASVAVESAPLEPVATAPQSQPAAQTAPSPASTGPAAVAPSAAAASPPAASPSPPPSASAAPSAAPPASAAPSPAPPPPEAYQAPPVRRSEVRYLADGKVVAAHGMYRDYQVQKGDHLDAIARDLKTSRSELIEANHLRKPYGLRPGEHLKVPVAQAYVVGGGDTLAAVAKRFGVGLGELAALNDLPEHGRLTAGMFVALPAQYDDHGPTRITVTEQAQVAPRPRAVYRPAAPASAPPIRRPRGTLCAQPRGRRRRRRPAGRDRPAVVVAQLLLFAPSGLNGAGAGLLFEPPGRGPSQCRRAGRPWTGQVHLAGQGRSPVQIWRGRHGPAQ